MSLATACTSTASPARSDLPRITLITPSYNQAAFLEQTLRSVLYQSYPNLQLIVVDGGSTDGSIDILKRYQYVIELNGGRVMIEPDRGQTHAINKGFALADGEIINWLCSDDTLVPEALDAVGQHFQSHPQSVWCAGNVVLTDAAGTPLRDTPPTEPCCLADVLLRSPQQPFNLAQPGVFWKRSLLEAHGLLDESLHYCMDFEFWCRLLAHGHRPDVIHHTLAHYRLHEQSKTVAAKQHFLREHIEIESRYLPQLPKAQQRRSRQQVGYQTRALAIQQANGALWKEILRRPWWLGSQQVRDALIGRTPQPDSLAA